jgi:hypothetical protein
MGSATLLAPVREFFLLETPRRVLSEYTPQQHRRVAELREAGGERLGAARRASSVLAACLLLRDAVALLARARAMARDASLDEEELARLDVSREVPELAADPVDGRRGDSGRVRDALSAVDPLYFDRLDPASRAHLCAALDRAAVALRRGVEARSLGHVRALRWGRMAALGVVLLYAAWLVVRPRVMPVNLAVGKPVKVSSYRVNPPDGQELAVGRPGFTYAVLTNTEDSPHVVIDLQGDYAIRRIAVTNRADGWWDDCLPLVVELSRDDKTYTELARRETHFGFDTPWVIPASERMARYVRVRVARRSYLALGRVEIFGYKP